MTVVRWSDILVGGRVCGLCGYHVVDSVGVASQSRNRAVGEKPSKREQERRCRSGTRHGKHSAFGIQIRHRITDFPVPCSLKYGWSMQASRSKEDSAFRGGVPSDDPRPSRKSQLFGLGNDSDVQLRSRKDVETYSRNRDPSPSRGNEVDGGYQFWKDVTKETNVTPPQGNSLNKYILGGLFVLGMGAGIAVDTVVNIEPNNIASREVIDRQTPNPDVCISNGMSAMVLDQRLFITFNPFNVYVSQAEVKPGCVLRQSNWRVLESRSLVSSEQVRDCKRNFNTFGFVGDLRQAPEITCVYHSEAAENQFLKDPSKAALGDGFQPKDFDK